MQERRITDPMGDLDDLLTELEMLADTLLVLEIGLSNGEESVLGRALSLPVLMLQEKTQLAREAFQMVRRV